MSIHILPRFSLLVTVALTPSLSCGGPAPGPGTDPSDGAADALLEQARALQDRIIVLDSHAGFAGDPLDTCEDTERQVDVPKIERGGVDAIFFTTFARQAERTPVGYAAAQREALEVVRQIHSLVALCPELALAQSPDDVDEIVARGSKAIVIGMENGFMVGPDLSLLPTFVEQGGAYLGLTHDGHNQLADAAIPREDLGDELVEHDGLSHLGEEVIGELNRLGVMVDVSHMSRTATRQAIERSNAPVVASHSAMYALVPHPRNMDDETLLALAAKGGVVQIPAVHEFLKTDPPGVMETFHALLDEFGLETDAQARQLPPDRRVEFEARYAEFAQRWPLATVDDLVDHIDHAVGLVGADHVGIGSDFEGGAGLDGWADASETPNVTAALLQRGYTEQEIEKIWGGNFLRVWREVQSRATGGHGGR